MSQAAPTPRCPNHSEGGLRAYAMWLIVSLFLLYDVLLRVFPNILVNQLQQRYHIDAFDLGTLSACYMWSFGLMQIPAGVLIDRFGIKWPLVTGAAVATIGVALMIFSPWFALACFARVIMGFGAAFAFIGCMRVIFDWFSFYRRAVLTGFTMTIGALGGVVCNALLVRLVVAGWWHDVMLGICAFGLLLTFLIATFVDCHPNRERAMDEHCHLLRGVRDVLRLPSSWVVGLICGLLYLPYAVLNDLWGVPFLQVVDHMPKAEAGTLVAMIWIGWLVGSPILGYIADRLKDCVRVMLCAAVAQVAAVIGLLSIAGLQYWSLMLVAILIGMTASAMALCYVYGQTLVGKHAASASSAFMNTMVTVVVLLTLPLVGWLIDHNAAGHVHAAVKDILGYPVAAYQVGLIPLAVGCVLALVLLAGLRFVVGAGVSRAQGFKVKAA